MLTPAFTFLMVTALVSGDPAAIESWREHFYARRRPFFGMFLLTLLTIPARQSIVVGDAVSPIFAGLPLAMTLAPIAMGCIGLISGSERVHAALAIGIAALTITLWVAL